MCNCAMFLLVVVVGIIYIMPCCPHYLLLPTLYAIFENGNCVPEMDRNADERRIHFMLHYIYTLSTLILTLYMYVMCESAPFYMVRSSRVAPW